MRKPDNRPLRQMPGAKEVGIAAAATGAMLAPFLVSHALRDDDSSKRTDAPVAVSTSLPGTNWSRINQNANIETPPATVTTLTTAEITTTTQPERRVRLPRQQRPPRTTTTTTIPTTTTVTIDTSQIARDILQPPTTTTPSTTSTTQPESSNTLPNPTTTTTSTTLAPTTTTIEIPTTTTTIPDQDPGFPESPSILRAREAFLDPTNTDRYRINGEVIIFEAPGEDGQNFYAAASDPLFWYDNEGAMMVIMLHNPVTLNEMELYEFSVGELEVHDVYGDGVSITPVGPGALTPMTEAGVFMMPNGEQAGAWLPITDPANQLSANPHEAFVDSNGELSLVQGMPPGNFI